MRSKTSAQGLKTLILRFFFLVIAWLSLAYYAFPWSELDIQVPFSGPEYRLWLDLQGWIELDYRVDLSEARLEKDYSPAREKEILEGLKLIIDKRITSLNINDSVLVTANYGWEKHIIVQIPLKWNTWLENQENIEKAKKAIWKVVRIKFKELDKENSTFENDVWIVARWKWNDWYLRPLDERFFIKSSVQFSQTGEPMIELLFDDEWRSIFWDLSTRLVWERMAIFVWGELLTDPVINEPILWGKAQVTGNFTNEEAVALSQSINTWVVPAPIYLTSERSINAKLGAESLKELMIAWLIWFLLIFIFLIYTYRLSWLVASISLIMYVIIILVIIKSTWTVLTLASIAWLILSIGMAIDANILIFERIREEIKLWKNLPEASKVWFKESWTAIWDSNITGLIVAMILFIFGINMIKGFGLMLAIWIVVSLFSVMYISRVFLLLVAETTEKKVRFIGK